MDNAIATHAEADDIDFIGGFTSRETMFCSMEPKDDKERAMLFNAMNNPDKRLGDCINTTIKMKDLFCEVVSLENKNTGEIDKCPRIVIIDDKGVGYAAVSLGIYSALKKIIALYGPPTWEQPVPVEIKQLTKGERKMLTLNIKT